MTMSVRGYASKLYQGVAAADLAALTELDIVGDVTVTLGSSEADVSTRAGAGWRSVIQTLRECTIEINLRWIPGDAGMEALRDAYLAGTPIELAALDGDRNASGSQGIKGSFAITQFNRAEPLADALTVAVTAKLTTFDEWVEVT
jgi:hypothetical protein